MPRSFEHLSSLCQVAAAQESQERAEKLAADVLAKESELHQLNNLNKSLKVR